MTGKVSDLYTLYLKPRHLPQKGSREATIEKATVETLHPKPGLEKEMIVISFVGKQHKFILNQGNANRMFDIGSDDYHKWAGLVIGLERGKWGKKDTIIIGPATNGNGNGGAS